MKDSFSHRDALQFMHYTWDLLRLNKTTDRISEQGSYKAKTTKRKFCSTFRMLTRKTKRSKWRVRKYSKDEHHLKEENKNNSKSLEPQNFMKTKTKSQFYSSINNSNCLNTLNKTDKSYYFKDITDEIKQLRNCQKETGNKLDTIISLLNSQNNKHLQVEQFGFDVLQMNKLSADTPVFDYFSFKIKPNLSLSSMNDPDSKKSSRDFKRAKCPSPDRLIAHKFFEDSENFRNTNLMSVKTFSNNHTASNPFCLSGKTDEMIILNSDGKIEKEREADDISISMINYSEKDKRTPFSEEDNEENSPTEKMFSDQTDHNEPTNDLVNLGHNTPIKEESAFNTMTDSNANITNSDNNDAVSLTSSKFTLESSNDRFKKVRGFNFKNNINTKKYSKPLFTSQFNNKEKESKDKDNHNSNLLLNSSQNLNTLMKSEMTVIHSNSSNVESNEPSENKINNFVNKSSNFEDKIKIRKFNFNNLTTMNNNLNNITSNNLISNLNNLGNNINNVLTKKKSQSDMNVNKERGKQYTVEIDESENEPITINDLATNNE